MRARYLVSIALVCALASAGCGDDDSDASGNPFSNGSGGSRATASTGGRGSTNGSTSSGSGSGGTNAGSAGSGGSAMPGPDMKGDGMMMPPKPGDMTPPMMIVCPDAKPEEDSACTMGAGMCKFAELECRCREAKWHCEPHKTMKKPDEDGGVMTP